VLSPAFCIYFPAVSQAIGIDGRRGIGHWMLNRLFYMLFSAGLYTWNHTGENGRYCLHLRWE
jgi:hypothetical protein